MCVINGASLFTSNIAYMMAAFIERRSTGMQALWVVWLSYLSNLVGELFFGGAGLDWQVLCLVGL